MDRSEFEMKAMKIIFRIVGAVESQEQDHRRSSRDSQVLGELVREWIGEIMPTREMNYHCIHGGCPFNDKGYCQN